MRIYNTTRRASSLCDSNQSTIALKAKLLNKVDHVPWRYETMLDSTQSVISLVLYNPNERDMSTVENA